MNIRVSDELFMMARVAVNQMICMGGHKICQPCKDRERLARALESYRRSRHWTRKQVIAMLRGRT
jgi:hypothetical protein